MCRLCKHLYCKTHASKVPNVCQINHSTNYRKHPKNGTNGTIFASLEMSESGLGAEEIEREEMKCERAEEVANEDWEY